MSSFYSIQVARLLQPIQPGIFGTSRAQRLVRMRVLDSARLQKHSIVLIDGTGYLVFNHRH